MAKPSKAPITDYYVYHIKVAYKGTDTLPHKGSRECNRRLLTSQLNALRSILGDPAVEATLVKVERLT